MQRIARSSSTVLALTPRNFHSSPRARVESVPPGQPPPPKSGGNVLPLFFVALVIGGGGYYYYTQGEPERDKAKIERDAKSGVAKARHLVDEANARAEAGATEALEKASGIVDQTRAGFEQTKEKASQYASDTQRKVYEIRDKASKTSKDYYGKADALRGETVVQGSKVGAEAEEKIKSSWWSWLGWSSSKKDEIKETKGEQWKPAMKKEWDEVKKGPNT